MKTNDDNSTPRRKFIKNGIALGVGFSINYPDILAGVGQETSGESSDLSDTVKKLLTLFNLKYPIFQAAPGGELLAATLANTGAMGAISLTMTSPEDAYQKVSKVKAATKGSFYGNYILHFEPESLDKALEAGLSIVQFSWGIPGNEMVSKIRAANAKLGIQVASKENAKAVMQLNPDFLICQGVEAGGHVQANESLFHILQDIIKEANDIPVLASGGIATANDIRRALKAGAAGVVMGTRFMATKESDAHEEYKRSLVEAGESSTVFTTCFDKEWYALHRVLKNKTFQHWQAAGCPLKGHRPGENDIIATGDNEFKVERYSIMPPFAGLQGRINEMAMYAGEGVKHINDIPPAADLIKKFWAELQSKK